MRSDRWERRGKRGIGERRRHYNGKVNRFSISSTCFRGFVRNKNWAKGEVIRGRIKSSIVGVTDEATADGKAISSSVLSNYPPRICSAWRSPSEVPCFSVASRSRQASTIHSITKGVMYQAQIGPLFTQWEILNPCV